MSIPLRTCLIFALITVRQIFCLPTFMNIPTVAINKNAISANLEYRTLEILNEATENTALNNKSKGSFILMPKVKTENQEFRQSSVDEDSNIETASVILVTRFYKASGKVTRKVSRLISENKNRKSATLSNPKKHAKLKIFNKPYNIVRYARSLDEDQLPSNDTNRSGVQPDGYVYDINHCQYIDDRVLCGYEKNPQEPKKKEIVDLDDLCRKHGERIECGYLKGPFPDVYNLDPNDKLGKISMANYQNIARAGLNKNRHISSDQSQDSKNIEDDGNDDDDGIDDDGNDNDSLESLRTKKEMKGKKKKHTKTTTISVPNKVVVKEIPRPKVSLSEMLKLEDEPEKLTLENLMRSDTNYFPEQFKKAGKTCIEKDGRIFCRTLATV